MLTADEETMLEIAAAHLDGRVHLGRAAHARLGLSSTRFAQRLDGLVRTRAAIEHDPVTCRRVREVAGA